ncbi:hypothetical protein EDEG_04118 [Edhazardia aedis USNM 41457]|uniref:Uncharacterized protein n=1 Tax=Edhazardia aedis (strain USNM 41457) TaxID=1003232 RepID=J9DV08_EDHAE|nr:hypothetical protein EDEG_04118 [Edhazardia aedis USNM 41457]|eukprot:EJW05107.1 hypothetical protein EDEG_04118 [Edhazardia aedis USNM 41457]
MNLLFCGKNVLLVSFLCMCHQLIILYMMNSLNSFFSSEQKFTDLIPRYLVRLEQNIINHSFFCYHLGQYISKLHLITIDLYFLCFTVRIVTIYDKDRFKM